MCSQLYARVDRRDSKCEILPRLALRDREACFSDHGREPSLRREPLDRFDEVLVRVAIRSDDVTEVRDDLEGVEVVNSAGRNKSQVVCI